MCLTRKILMNKIDILKSDSSNSKFKNHVLTGLNHIANNFENYRDTIECPFHLHMWHKITNLQEDYDESFYFELFEDIAVVFRLKTINDEKNIHKVEKDFLNAFEGSGEWNKDDGTLVSLWYWSILPESASCFTNIK